MFKIKPVKTKDISSKYNKYLKKFPELFPFFFRCAIIAKSNSGKTDLMINLMRFYMKYSGFIAPDDIILFSPTIDSGDNREKYKTLGLPDENIHRYLTPDALEEVIMKRAEIREPYILLIDDLSGSLHENKMLDDLMTKIRHALGNVIICCHKWKCLSTMIRLNLSHIILMKGLEDNIKEFKSVAEELGGKHGPDGFKKIYQMATVEPFSFLVVDNSLNPQFRYRSCLDTGLEVSNIGEM